MSRLGTIRQLRSQLTQRLGVDLAHPALGDAQDLSDLGEGQAVVVVHHQNRALAVGHGGHGGHEGLLGLLGLEGVDRAPGTVGQRLTERGSLGPVPTSQHLVERHHAHRGDLAQRLVELPDAHVQLGRHLGVVRRPAQGRFEVRHRLLDGPCLGPHRSGHPVDRPELVDDRSLDAGDGIGLEPQVPVDLEALDGVDQPDDPVADQILLVEVPWKAGQDPAGHVLDEGRVIDDELIAQRLRTRPLELGPQHVDAHVGGHFHRGSLSSRRSHGCPLSFGTVRPVSRRPEPGLATVRISCVRGEDNSGGGELPPSCFTVVGRLQRSRNRCATFDALHPRCA